MTTEADRKTGSGRARPGRFGAAGSGPPPPPPPPPPGPCPQVTSRRRSAGTFGRRPAGRPGIGGGGGVVGSGQLAGRWTCYSRLQL